MNFLPSFGPLQLSKPSESQTNECYPDFLLETSTKLALAIKGFGLTNYFLECYLSLSFIPLIKFSIFLANQEK